MLDLETPLGYQGHDEIALKLPLHNTSFQKLSCSYSLKSGILDMMKLLNITQ